jgi:hypothetical protein
MRNKLAVLAITLAAAMPLGASAQGLNAGLSGSSGGVGVGRHGTGFDGTMGDPLYQVGQAPGQFIPGYPVTGHASISDAGALGGPAPGIPGYAPPPPPILYQYGPPPAR